jgi:hypothetical protein
MSQIHRQLLELGKNACGPIRGKGYGQPIRIASRATRKIYRQLTSPCRALPDFLLIGVVKGGTTSFFWDLCCHVQIASPVCKEVNYFNLNTDKSLNWYRAHFPMRSRLRNAVVRKITGEASARYFYTPDAPKQVQRFMPDVRLIVMLRNPVDRAFSQYQMHRRHASRHSRTLPTFEVQIRRELECARRHPIQVEAYEEAAGSYDLRYVRRGVYLPFIHYWLSVFGREQMLILRSEDYFENPMPVLEQAFIFLAVSTDNLGHITPNRLNLGGYQDEMPADVRQELEEFFEPHNKALYEFLQRDMCW